MKGLERAETAVSLLAPGQSLEAGSRPAAGLPAGADVTAAMLKAWLMHSFMLSQHKITIHTSKMYSNNA